MKALLLPLLIFCAVVQAKEPNIVEGISVRGGGGDTAEEFGARLHEAIKDIRERYPDIWAMISHCDWDKYPRKDVDFIYETTQAIKAQTPFGEQDSVAGNDSAHSVLINTRRWKAVTLIEIKRAIALHEVGSTKFCSNIEKTGQYSASVQYLKKVGLPADPQLLISGQDPFTKSKLKTIRTTCDVRTKVQKTSGAVEELTDFDVKTTVTWKVLNGNYTLSYLIKNDIPDPRAPRVVFYQKVERELSNDANGVMTRVKGRGLSYFPSIPNRIFDSYPTPKEELVEDASDGSVKVWLMEKGKKVKLLDSFVQTQLTPNNIQVEHDWSGSHRVNELGRTLSSFQNCFNEIVPPEEWASSVRDQNVVVDLNSITALATMANDADRLYKGCAAENCEARKKDLERAVKNFDRAWEQLYTSRRAQLAKERNAPIPTPYKPTEAEMKMLRSQKKIDKPVEPKAVPARVIRMPGQSATLSRSEQGALNALRAFKKNQ